MDTISHLSHPQLFSIEWLIICIALGFMIYLLLSMFSITRERKKLSLHKERLGLLIRNMKAMPIKNFIIFDMEEVLSLEYVNGVPCYQKDSPTYNDDYIFYAGNKLVYAGPYDDYNFFNEGLEIVIDNSSIFFPWKEDWKM